MNKDVSIEEARKIIAENQDNTNFLILDVRTSDEYDDGHIDGAVNADIYAYDFKDRLRKLNKDGKYLVHCRTGVRSCDAAKIMKEMNFKEIYHMHEGIQGWRAKRLPLLK